MSYSAQATLTKYCSGLNKTHVFLAVLEPGKSKITVLTDLMPEERPLLGLLSSCCIYTWRRESSGLSCSFKDTNLIMGAPFSWSHLNIIIPHRLHLQITSHWRWRLSIWIWGGTNIQSITFSLWPSKFMSSHAKYIQSISTALHILPHSRINSKVYKVRSLI